MVHQSQFIEMFGESFSSNATIPLSEMVQDSRPITYGVIKPGDFVEDGVVLVRVKDIVDGKVLLADLRKITSTVAQNYVRSTLSPGDILLSIRGTIGRTAIVPKELDGANITQDTARISLREEFNNHFIKCVLDSPVIQSWIQLHVKGLAVKGINLEDVRRIPIPSVKNELQEIYIALYHQADKSKFDGFKSQFIEMFGTISGNTPLSLGDFFSMKAGKSIIAEDIKLDQEEDLYPCYGGNGVRGYVTSYTHEGDTVLIGRQGALCGNVQIARNKFYATEHAVVVTPKTPVNISWLYYALKSMELNQYARGVAQPGLAVGQLEKLPFVLPSMKSQNEFARVSHQADKSKYLN